MNNHAHIEWNNAEKRYDLTIGGKLKAYTEEDHEVGLNELIKMVEEKGYVAIVGKQ